MSVCECLACVQRAVSLLMSVKGKVVCVNTIVHINVFKSSEAQGSVRGKHLRPTDHNEESKTRN